MALGRIIVDGLQEIGPMFSWVGDLFAELLPAAIKVFGYLLDGEPVAIGIAAVLIPVVAAIIRWWIRKRRLNPASPGPKIPAMILGLVFGLVTLGSAYVFWRINAGGYVDESRMLVVAPTLGVPVLFSMVFLRPNSWQMVPLAIIAVGVALTAGVCIADFKVFL